jgi:hypothetical protein
MHQACGIAWTGERPSRRLPGDDMAAPSPRPDSARPDRRARYEVWLGAGAAAALAVHRFLEGSALALAASVTVTAALTVHALAEGLAAGALLGSQPRRRATTWLTAMCLSPVAGAVVTSARPLPAAAGPVLLALAAGVLAQAAHQPGRCLTPVGLGTPQPHPVTPRRSSIRGQQAIGQRSAWLGRRDDPCRPSRPRHHRPGLPWAATNWPTPCCRAPAVPWFL